MAKVFFYHYNKPASKSTGKPVISVHHNKQCYLVDNICCNVPTWGKIRNRQPYFIVCGRTESLIIKDKIAYIN